MFDELEVLDTSYDELTTVLDSLSDLVIYELLFVDDGSSDGSYARLKEIAADNPRVTTIKLSRNFGHQNAITAGLDYSRGAAVVVIDADLQDPPELIRTFVLLWLAGNDVVYGKRIARPGESKTKRATAALFYRLLHQLTSINIPADAGDFRLMSRRATDEFLKLREKDRFVRGLVSWVGFKQVAVDYERRPRKAGSSKYPYRTMWKFAMDGVTSFSTAPLRLATILGYLTSSLAFVYLLYIFVQTVLGVTVPGWPSIMAVLLFLGGVQLICLGIVGEYIGRIFNEVKNRPIYVVEQIEANHRHVAQPYLPTPK